MRAFFGVGSNLGERWHNLGRCAQRLWELDNGLVISSVYETLPVGGPDGQGPYLNAVAMVSTDRAPRELLELARELESEAQRVRTVRWGPRTLDVDVLLAGDFKIDDDDFVVPHPRMYERAFVMCPLFEIAPDVAGNEWRAAFGGADAIAKSVWPVGALVSVTPGGVRAGSS